MVGTPTVEEIALAIVEREGGFVNDPDDPGGPTNHGVTLATARAHGLDLDGDGDVDVDDVRLITDDVAAKLFIRRYYLQPRIDLLPECVQPAVMDMCVHSGDNAVRIFQRLLNELGGKPAMLGKWAPVVEDGKIGPKTVKAARLCCETVGPDNLRNWYGKARREWYYLQGDRRSRSRKYIVRLNGGKGGWIVRAEDFMDASYRLSQAEHRQRTKAWA